MLNYVWLAMLLIGFALGIMNGRVQEVTNAAIDSAGVAVKLSIGLLGVMCLWTGLMGIAERSGMIRLIAKMASPFMKFLFPGIPERHPAMGSVVMNLAANFLGMGNAATPLGLKAMNELQKLNPAKETATNAMCMFLVLNTSLIQLVPATVIALRAEALSSNPAEIIFAVWISSTCALMAGIVSVKLLTAFTLKNKNRFEKKYRRTG